MYPTRDKFPGLIIGVGHYVMCILRLNFELRRELERGYEIWTLWGEICSYIPNYDFVTCEGIHLSWIIACLEKRWMDTWIGMSQNRGIIKSTICPTRIKWLNSFAWCTNKSHAQTCNPPQPWNLLCRVESPIPAIARIFARWRKAIYNYLSILSSNFVQLSNACHASIMINNIANGSSSPATYTDQIDPGRVSNQNKPSEILSKK